MEPESGSLLRLINLSYIIQLLDVGNQLRLFLNVFMYTR